MLETLERGAHFDVKVEENAARVLLKDSAAQHAEKPTREVADLRVLKGLVEMLKRQHPPGDTLHSVVQLTSYISSQTYALVTPYTSFRAAGVQGSASLNPAEDEIRREIRSLKSLLLNRCVHRPQWANTADHSQAFVRPTKDGHAYSLSVRCLTYVHVL